MIRKKRTPKNGKDNRHAIKIKQMFVDIYNKVKLTGSSKLANF